MLDIENLNTVYYQAGHTAHALRDVSITVPRGVAVALIGESGSGKSTVALSAMGLIRPPVGQVTSGRIVVDGLDIAACSARQVRDVLRNRIGFVPQDPTTALDPLFTVRTQIKEALPPDFDGSADEFLETLLQSLGIQNAHRRLRDHPHQFSGGMKQRVAIAIALAKSPTILIADEPTTALDVTTQLGILRLLDNLRRERELATLFITHDVRAARLLCQFAVVMYGGIVVESGPGDVVWTRPIHPYTRALMDASALGDVPRQRIRAIPGSPPSLLSMPPGCPFAPRCTRVQPQCSQRLPEPTTSDGRTVVCWNPEPT